MLGSTSPLPLIDRPPGVALFQSVAGTVTREAFLAAARTVANALPGSGPIINVCRDHCLFAIGLAATLLERRISVLSGDPSAAMLERLAAEFPDARVLTDADVHRVVPELIASGISSAEAAPELSADQPAIIVLTSGTTGRPTGTRKGWGELVARSRAAGERFGLTEDDPAGILGTVPPGHMYGLETTTLLPWHAAASVRGERAFFPADIGPGLAALGENTILVTTPLHLRAALDGAPQPPPRRVISATAPLERALAERAEHAWGCRVFEIFGASEVGSIASRRTVEEDEWSLYPGVTLDLAGAAPLVSAPGAASRPLADRLEITPDLRHFRLLGRDSDTVKLAGRRASLAGLSRILLEIEGVQDGVFVAPDDLDRSPVVRLAVIAVAPQHSVVSLMLALRARIDPVFLPRPLVLLNRLPRDALGKSPRAALLEVLASRTR